MILALSSWHGPVAADQAALVDQVIAIRRTGDLDVMMKDRVIRVLVSPKKTEYFVVKGQQRGFEYELMEAYKRFINKGRKKKSLEIEVVYIPVPFERLLTDLVDGRGDVAAAGLTVTPEREKKVAFTIPYFPDVSEVVVSHKSEKNLASVDDLSGRTLYVLRNSSYVQHLKRLNGRFKSQGRTPVKVLEAEPYLATEDILELVNAGIVELTVSDDHIARLWAKVLPDIVVHDEAAVNTNGKIAWAVRKNNPKLRESLNEFLAQHRQGTLLGNVLFERYFQGTRWIDNPLQRSDRKKLKIYEHYFKKYAAMYDFDWRLIAALAFQESRLDPQENSRAGAVGIMQIRPETASDRNIGIDDIYKVENNIHAGVKYLAFLRDRYYSGPEFTSKTRIHFSLAAYNAGPARVRQMRTRAEKMGLDSNVWFRNVERAGRAMVGTETPRYVANIHKYYLAYTLLGDIYEIREEEKSRIE